MAFTFSFWFDNEAEAAAHFYTTLFPDGALGAKSFYTGAGEGVHGQPADRLMTQAFRLAGLDFVGVNGGPDFRPNPAISFFVFTESEAEIDRYWDALSEGGKVLMPLQAYDFAPRYGWVQDRFGVSWQLMSGQEKVQQKIMPAFLFTQHNYGQARAALYHYSEVFPDSRINDIVPYGDEQTVERSDAIAYSDLVLGGLWFAVMESGLQHEFTFNEGISIEIRCADQQSVDYYWEQLSCDEQAEQCGWLKDRYGVSWQVVPERLHELLATGRSDQVDRVMTALLPMKKIDLATLERAFQGP